jgi:hypothetical protein
MLDISKSHFCLTSLQAFLLPHTRQFLIAFRAYQRILVTSCNSLIFSTSSTNTGNRSFDDPAQHLSVQRNSYSSPNAPSRDPSPSGRLATLSQFMKFTAMPNILQRAEQNRPLLRYLSWSRLPERHRLRIPGAANIMLETEVLQIHLLLPPNRLVRSRIQRTKLRVAGSAALLCEEGSLPYILFCSNSMITVRFRSLSSTVFI